ncbi:uncharacterized protein LOC130190752 isoform X2 [Pseudoliparis swirei]|uniref:uncharacterized protein LOC130190752 isoform X2 n=1 Tax=Pseudoliparis swirei TaxID=2059687 RepID=UPI0024BDE40A|nr:uncharacterized protein LOC130190752 isoform X2 [Pseudoliparis swirei]
MFARHGKLVSPIRVISSGFKESLMKHILSYRRSVYMILNDRSAELNLRFSVRVDDVNYNVYASSSAMKCFQCGQEGHTARVCSKRGDPAPAGPGGAGPSGVSRRAGPAWGEATAASLRGGTAGAAAAPIPAESAASGVTTAVPDTHVLVDAVGPTLSDPPALGSLLGLHSDRVARRLLELWRQRLTGLEEPPQRLQSAESRAGPCRPLPRHLPQPGARGTHRPPAKNEPPRKLHTEQSRQEDFVF